MTGNFPKKKVPDMDVFTDESDQTLKEEITNSLQFSPENRSRENTS